MTDPRAWDRDRDGPGVIRYGPVAEWIEAMPMEEFLRLVVALAKLGLKKPADPPEGV